MPKPSVEKSDGKDLDPASASEQVSEEEAEGAPLEPEETVPAPPGAVRCLLRKVRL